MINCSLKKIFLANIVMMFTLSIGSVLHAQVKKSPVAPDYQLVQDLVNQAYNEYKDLKEGAVADYIPELAKVDPELFGIAIVTVDGKVFTAGDVEHLFSIQSISKVYTLAMVMEQLGEDAILEKLGVEPTGMPFNSVLAIEFQETKVGNPLVNAGAIATASLIEGTSEVAKWEDILSFYSECAGRKLFIMQDVYESEAATNDRNQAIARLLAAYGRMYDEPARAVDLYTRQCSVGINCKDLAAMGATMAAGGINPFTGEQVFSNDHVPQLLAVMLSCGMYDYSGTWSYTTGLPSKSGVGGGIVSVVPGKGAIAAFSPRLDGAGNSIRAQKAIKYISDRLNINIFAPQSVGVN